MSVKDIDSAIEKAMDEAEEIPELIEFTQENWEKAFPDNKVATPIGEIKIGENQFKKMRVKARKGEIGLMNATL